MFNIKKCSDRIALIKAKAESEMPAIMSNLKNPSEQEFDNYQRARLALNELLITTVIGAEIVTGKKGKTLKFNHPIPTTEELAEICRILDNFGKREAEFCDAYAKHKAELEKSKVGELDDVDDISDIEFTGFAYAPKYEDIADIPKMNAKTLKQEVITNGLTYRMVGNTGLMTIAGWGAKVRRDRDLQILLISLATGVAVAAGVTAGVYYYNKKHSNNEIGDDDFTTIDMTDDDTAIDADVEIDDADTPVVDFE